MTPSKLAAKLDANLKLLKQRLNAVAEAYDSREYTADEWEDLVSDVLQFYKEKLARMEQKFAGNVTTEEWSPQDVRTALAAWSDSFVDQAQQTFRQDPEFENDGLWLKEEGKVTS